MKHAIIIYQDGYQHEVLPGVESIFESYNLNYGSFERDLVKHSDCAKKDLMIIIGGDGTFLRASHKNKGIPMFGINPNPARKEGFFMQSTKDDYKLKLKSILEGKYELLKLLKLNIAIDGKMLKETALNDVYIGDAKPYNMFNYNITLRGKTEFQRSSGVIVGTAAGSHAWLKSAGAKVLSINEHKLQFVSRELYENKLTKGYNLRKGIFSKKDILTIYCKTDAILVLDSVSKEYKCPKGTTVEIFACDTCVKYIKL